MEYLLVLLCTSNLMAGILAACDRGLTEEQIRQRCRHPSGATYGPNAGPVCNGRGNCEGCGLCNCHTDPNTGEGYYGNLCECTEEYCIDPNCDFTERAIIEAMCKPSPKADVCNGRGVCRGCGECDCDPVSRGNPYHTFTGRFCECSDVSCDYSDGEICGGPSQGKCICGECVCQPGFTGSDCACPVSADSCMASNGLVCAGRGMCMCGRCECTEGFYTGSTCEDCPTCPGACERTRVCIKCTQEGPEDDVHGCGDCGEVEYVEFIGDLDGTEWKTCRFRDDDDDCFHTHAYNMNDPRQIKLHTTAECPHSNAKTAHHTTNTPRRSNGDTMLSTTTSNIGQSSTLTSSTSSETKDKKIASKKGSGEMSSNRTTIVSPHWVTTITTVILVVYLALL